MYKRFWLTLPIQKLRKKCHITWEYGRDPRSMLYDSKECLDNSHIFGVQKELSVWGKWDLNEAQLLWGRLRLVLVAHLELRSTVGYSEWTPFVMPRCQRMQNTSGWSAKANIYGVVLRSGYHIRHSFEKSLEYQGAHCNGMLCMHTFSNSRSNCRWNGELSDLSLSFNEPSKRSRRQ